MDQDNSVYQNALKNITTSKTKEFSAKSNIDTDEMKRKAQDTINKDDFSVYSYEDENGNETEESPKETVKRVLNYELVDTVLDTLRQMYSKSVKMKVETDQDFLSKMNEIRENEEPIDFVNALAEVNKILIKTRTGSQMSKAISAEESKKLVSICEKYISSYNKTLDMSEPEKSQENVDKIQDEKDNQDKAVATDNTKTNSQKKSDVMKQVSNTLTYDEKATGKFLARNSNAKQNSKVLVAKQNASLDEIYSSIELVKSVDDSNIVIKDGSLIVDISKFKSLDQAKVVHQKAKAKSNTKNATEVGNEDKVKGTKDVVFSEELSNSEKVNVEEAIKNGAKVTSDVIGKQEVNAILNEVDNKENVETQELNEKNNEEHIKAADAAINEAINETTFNVIDDEETSKKAIKEQELIEEKRKKDTNDTISKNNEDNQERLGKFSKETMNEGKMYLIADFEKDAKNKLEKEKTTDKEQEDDDEHQLGPNTDHNNGR